MKRRYTSWIPGNNFVIPRTTWGISRGCYFVSRMEEDAGEKNISCVYEKRENREEDDAWSHVIGHFVFLHCWFLMCYFSSRMSFPDSVHHVFHVLFFWVFHTLFPLHFGWRDVPYLSWRRERERVVTLSLYIYTSFSWRRKFVLTQQQWVLAWRSHDSFLISFHQTWFLVRWLFPSCLFRGEKRINKCLQRTRF